MCTSNCSTEILLFDFLLNLNTISCLVLVFQKMLILYLVQNFVNKVVQAQASIYNKNYPLVFPMVKNASEHKLPSLWRRFLYSSRDNLKLVMIRGVNIVLNDYSSTRSVRRYYHRSTYTRRYQTLVPLKLNKCLSLRIFFQFDDFTNS